MQILFKEIRFSLEKSRDQKPNLSNKYWNKSRVLTVTVVVYKVLFGKHVQKFLGVFRSVKGDKNTPSELPSTVTGVKTVYAFS